MDGCRSLVQPLYISPGEAIEATIRHRPNVLFDVRWRLLDPRCWRVHEGDLRRIDAGHD
jgi:hypothetical protein